MQIIDNSNKQKVGETKGESKVSIPTPTKKEKPLISHKDVFEAIMRHIGNDHAVIGVGSDSNVNPMYARLAKMRELSGPHSHDRGITGHSKYRASPGLFMHILTEAKENAKKMKHAGSIPSKGV